jgi:ketosteroid isomerase-like protein
MLNTVPERDNVAVVRRLWDAFAEGGVEAVLEIADPDVEWSLYGTSGQVVRGHEGLRQYMADVAARGDEIDASAYTFEPVGDDAVLVSGHVRMRTPEGMTDTQLHWVYRFREGRLVRFDAYQTREEALRAAGPEE